MRTDHFGRPVFATDSAGVKVWEASYFPFGGVETSTGPNPDLRFPGQWFQAESGLHQNWMREYDPTTGRYLQADRLGLVDGASVYGYALQNPGRYSDLEGLTVEPGHKDYQYCKSIERRMDNIRKNIIRRDKDLKNNPQALPERALGQPLAASRHGHRVLINKDWNQLRELEKEYATRCGGDDGCGGTGEPQPQNAPQSTLPPPLILPRLPGRGVGGRYSPIAPLGGLSPWPGF